MHEHPRLAADGLTERTSDLWPDVGASSGRLGGDGERWERGPYHMRGLVALARALGDHRLIERARVWIEWSLASQRDDGFFGPAGNPDWWASIPMLDALRLHRESAGDPRGIPCLDRYFRHQLEHLPERRGAPSRAPSSSCCRAATRRSASRRRLP